jgi:glycosyltransferase involved in cell wall biosynthesis
VYCAHGWSFTMDVSQLKKRAYAGIETILSTVTDCIINISNHEETKARVYGLPGRKLVTILNGVGQAPNHDLDGAHFDSKNINLLFVGRHDPQKGLDLLLEAMAKVSNSKVHLHVLGDPVVSGGARFDNALDNVSFHGWVPRDRVSSYIAAADAIIMPSRWEGFGLAAIEAMRMRKPVIASDRGALPEIVENKRTGFIVNIDRSEQLIDVLQSLQRDELRQMGANAFEEYQKRFTAERMNKQISDVYSSVLKARN